MYKISDNNMRYSYFKRHYLSIFSLVPGFFTLNYKDLSLKFAFRLDYLNFFRNQIQIKFSYCLNHFTRLCLGEILFLNRLLFIVFCVFFIKLAFLPTVVVLAKFEDAIFHSHETHFGI